MNQTVVKSLKHSAEAGLSIIEILIGLTLLGLAGTFVAGKVFENLQQGRVQTTQIQIKALGDRLKEFRRDCGSYPTTDQGLDALIEKPTGGAKECTRYAPGGYIDGGKIPVDPWDGEYLYESDGKTFTITSYGADGVEGGEEFDADISSKDL
jgi:general secretion pathway protein G